MLSDRKRATLLCCNKVILLPAWLLFKEALVTVAQHCCLLPFQTQDGWQMGGQTNWLHGRRKQRAMLYLAMVESKVKSNCIDLCENVGR